MKQKPTSRESLEQLTFSTLCLSKQDLEAETSTLHKDPNVAPPRYQTIALRDSVVIN